MLLKQSTIQCGVPSDSAGLSTHHGAIIVYMHGQARDFLSSLVKYICIYICIYIYISTIDPSFGVIWRFPEKGVPLNHPFIDGFSIINIYNHQFWGIPMTMETFIWTMFPYFFTNLAIRSCRNQLFPSPKGPPLPTISRVTSLPSCESAKLPRWQDKGWRWL